jgi:hypothetical protein
MDARYRLVSRDSAGRGNTYARRAPTEDGNGWGQWREPASGYAPGGYAAGGYAPGGNAPGSYAAYGSAGRSNGWSRDGSGGWHRADQSGWQPQRGGFWSW